MTTPPEINTNAANVTTVIATYEGATAKVVVVPARHHLRMSVGWASRPGVFSTPGNLSRGQAQALSDALDAALDQWEVKR